MKTRLTSLDMENEAGDVRYTATSGFAPATSVVDLHQ